MQIAPFADGGRDALRASGARVADGEDATIWPRGTGPARAPYLLETTFPASSPSATRAPEARSGVAAAVGEGAICIQLVHRALLELMSPSDPAPPAAASAEGGGTLSGVPS